MLGAGTVNGLSCTCPENPMVLANWGDVRRVLDLHKCKLLQCQRLFAPTYPLIEPAAWVLYQLPWRSQAADSPPYDSLGSPSNLLPHTGRPVPEHPSDLSALVDQHPFWFCVHGLLGHSCLFVGTFITFHLSGFCSDSVCLGF